MGVKAKSEEHVWTLLVKNLPWQGQGDIGVKACGVAGRPRKFQVFELLLAAILADLRPDYEWYVTRVQGDEGVDFIGAAMFLEDPLLGINAAVTIAGQCKKWEGSKNLVEAIGGNLNRMLEAEPTFYLVALSARLDRGELEKAKKSLERIHRQCHLLDRGQIEGLFRDRLDLVERALRVLRMPGKEIDEILAYFAALKGPRPLGSVEVSPIESVAAGIPFTLTVEVRTPLVSSSALRLAWRPAAPNGASDRAVTLLDPVAAEEARGIEFVADKTAEDPLSAKRSLELISHAVGEVELGEIRVGVDASADSAFRKVLQKVRVVDERNPPFYAPPFEADLALLEREQERARAKGFAAVGVVGIGGTGKSRLCREFGQRQRRRGCTFVSVKQAKSLDDPYQLLVELFSTLADEDFSSVEAADGVIRAIRRYDAATATKAEPAIRAIFGGADRRSTGVIDESVLAALVLLVAAKGARAPLILHFEELHWCSYDLLVLLEQLVWHTNRSFATGSVSRGGNSGILMIFEGRLRERVAPSGDGWTSELFKSFLDKLDCPQVTCAAFRPEDGHEFIRLLFEDRYRARRVSPELLGEQDRLIDEIAQSAGGNPFHSLEQVAILKNRRVLGQNPKSGLLYLIQPEAGPQELPKKVGESIEDRWQYMREKTPGLALLVWASALLEDRLPMPLFRRLWGEIAPDTSLREVDATDMLWTGDGQAREVSFRHEHYFRSIQKFEVSPEEREQVAGIYADWFAGKHSPADRLKRARALLALPQPDVAGAQRLLRSALRGAEERGDVLLARRIATTSLDAAWEVDDESSIETAAFLRRCAEDLTLTRELLGSDRSQAKSRLGALIERLDERLAPGRRRSPRIGMEMQRRRLTAQLLEAQILFNDRKPARAAEVAARAVERVKALRPADGTAEDGKDWEALEVEALHSQSAALALSGEIDEAIEVSKRAVDIVRAPSSPLAHRVISTYANIFLARDPVASESILRECLEKLPDAAAEDERDPTEVNLAMALVLRAHRQKPGDEERAAALAESEGLLTGVSSRALSVGNFPIAGAAALMLGIVNTLLGDEGAEESWFRQAVASAARGSQMETLWRAHVNLATALHRHGAPVDDEVHDHAVAAFRILEKTLSPYRHPDRSTRFELVRVPLAQAVRFLIAAGDPAGPDALERYPALRACFEDMRKGTLRDDRGGHTSHEWLRIGDDDYVIY